MSKEMTKKERTSINGAYNIYQEVIVNSNNLLSLVFWRKMGYEDDRIATFAANQSVGELKSVAGQDVVLSEWGAILNNVKAVFPEFSSAKVSINLGELDRVNIRHQ